MEPATEVSWEYVNEICIFIERFILKQSSRAKTHQLLLHTDNLHILYIITLLFYSKNVVTIATGLSYDQDSIFNIIQRYIFICIIYGLLMGTENIYINILNLKMDNPC